MRFPEIRERLPSEKLSEIRKKLPSKDSVSKHLPSERTRLRLKIYAKVLLAVIILLVGATSAISGLVIIPMMAFAGAVLKVVGASAMLAVGAGVATIAYLWLTAAG